MAYYTQSNFEEACRQQGHNISNVLADIGITRSGYWRAKQKGRTSCRFAKRAAAILGMPISALFGGYVGNKNDRPMTPLRMAYQDKIAAFWMRVDKSDDCWLWTGCRTKSMYGVSSYPGSGDYAHRASWLIHFGAIPKGMDVLHTCDNPPCVKPTHLWLGTHQDNMRDRDLKGRCAAKRRGRNVIQ